MEEKREKEGPLYLSFLQFESLSSLLVCFVWENRFGNGVFAVETFREEESAKF